MTHTDRRPVERTPSSPHIRDFAEYCGDCGEQTPHDVSIELRIENERSDRPLLSREPYRITTCAECGRTTSTRMNNA